MNRRAFLSALGAVATQQRFGTLSPQRLQIEPELICEPPIFTIARFPYIQNVRSDRTSILWATFEPGFGVAKYTFDGVNYQFVGAKRRFFSRAETGLPYDYWQYQADLTGLSPNTDYLYSVSVDGQDVG